MEQQYAALQNENGQLKRKAQELSQQISDLESILENTSLELLYRDMLQNGFATGKMAPTKFQHLHQVIDNLKQKEGGIITGKYSMTKLSAPALWSDAQNDLLLFQLLATKFLSNRFGTGIGEVVMDEAAILTNPPITNGHGESAQFSHADDISGTGVTFIISLTNDCLSTYCLPVKYYGCEYPRQLSYDALIACDYTSSRKDQRKKAILDAVSARYRNVCNMSPREFFNKAEGGQIVPAGSYTAFRHDLLHAGPGGNQTRRVLFIHFRIQTHTTTTPRANIQYRFDTLMRLCGYAKEERKSLYDEWKSAGHWSPYESA